ncbi:flavodoxin [Neptuniibacter sp.]|uniref:flavodoxin n=1 Tax=Neptuniibacter sp. TaxID=1962643 RepID=UPI002633C872|nr:flavodoxin [Neptuniibacter sp.]
MDFFSAVVVMANIKILVGTVYGNALEVAELCRDKLTAKEHQVTLYRQADIEDVMADETEIILVSTSTTGQGEIPDSLLKLYCQLQDRSPVMPEVRYGLIALGDSSYDTYAEAGYLMDALLQKLQLQRIGAPLFIDACETRAPCEEAELWIEAWASQLG